MALTKYKPKHEENVAMRPSQSYQIRSKMEQPDHGMYFNFSQIFTFLPHISEYVCFCGHVVQLKSILKLVKQDIFSEILTH